MSPRLGRLSLPPLYCLTFPTLSDNASLTHCHTEFFRHCQSVGGTLPKEYDINVIL